MDLARTRVSAMEPSFVLLLEALELELFSTLNNILDASLRRPAARFNFSSSIALAFTTNRNVYFQDGGFKTREVPVPREFDRSSQTPKLNK